MTHLRDAVLVHLAARNLSPEDREDLAQQTMLHLVRELARPHRQLSRYRIRHQRAYAVEIARNLATDLLRHQAVVERSIPRLEPEALSVDDRIDLRRCCATVDPTVIQLLSGELDIDDLSGGDPVARDRWYKRRRRAVESIRIAFGLGRGAQ